MFLGGHEQHMKAVCSQVDSQIQQLKTELAEAKNKLVQGRTSKQEVVEKLKCENATLGQKVWQYKV